MPKHDDGGPAYPHDETTCTCHGITLRDEFASRALIGLIIRHPARIRPDDAHVKTAFKLADAMLAERGHDD